jgi:hypothetical protein
MLKVMLSSSPAQIHSQIVLLDHEGILSIYLEPEIWKYLPVRILAVCKTDAYSSITKWK